MVFRNRAGSTATRRVAHGAWRARLAALLAAGMLAACGGGSGGTNAGTSGTTGAGSTPTPVTPAAVVEMPASRAEAARFLGQASFGATDAAVDRLMAVGYQAWIDEQWAKSASSHRAIWEAADAAAKAIDPASGASADDVLAAFWQVAVTGDDQLRQRVAYALSQIFVVSMADGTVGNSPRAVAAWLDLLADKSTATYRDLLESVSRHPMMGVYLSHLKNQKADPKTGRVPDENYAREVMQLFSIGLVQLNADGSVKSDSTGQLTTYGPADISGLAKVFTGWSWTCPDWPDNSCFFWGSLNGNEDPARWFSAMVDYPQYHSKDEKRFLGATIAAQTTSDPVASLKVALDTLAAHANVGPFIGRQLIQRLVTSNPSPAYVKAVADAFADNGHGIRGDMKAVVNAVLMNPEARKSSDTAGKLREPVLRLSALLRAYPWTSDSTRWKVGNTDDPGSALGQSPLRSPSVFNFYRPGYVPPGTQAAARGLVVPEMQIAHETTAAGYVNYVRDGLSSGFGTFGSTLKRRDLQPDLSAELGVADQPATLVTRASDKLMGGAMPAALKAEIQSAIESIVIPAATATNAAQVDSAKRNRVNSALLLTVASPEFLIQK
jgi:uncharacterized protein (DUF1800 family)